jgi:hypothetical protein
MFIIINYFKQLIIESDTTRIKVRIPNDEDLFAYFINNNNKPHSLKLNLDSYSTTTSTTTSSSNSRQFNSDIDRCHVAIIYVCELLFDYPSTICVKRH